MTVVVLFICYGMWLNGVTGIRGREAGFGYT
jgi:hypothetical protein